MSEILIGQNPEKPSETTTLPDTPEKKAKQIPEPSGFHVLCMVPEIEDKFDSGIVKAETTMFAEERLTTVLFVMKLGPDCYKDASRFPSGPWCKEGDFVLVRPTTGTRLLIHGQEFRIINDDTVEGVVEDPRGISRAG
jgi:co-chaperonin GroES (HSP10)